MSFELRKVFGVILKLRLFGYMEISIVTILHHSVCYYAPLPRTWILFAVVKNPKKPG